MVRSALLSILVLLASCGMARSIYVEGPRDFAMLNPSPRPLSSRAAESVEVFVTSKPSHSFVEVGVWSRSDHLEESVDPMRKEAAVVGCDAILLSQRTTHTPGTPAQTKTYTFYGPPRISHPGEAYSTTTMTTTIPGTSAREVPETVAVCVVYSDLAPSFRPAAHPCDAPLERIRNASNEDKRAAVRKAPSECLRMSPPKVPVAEGS